MVEYSKFGAAARKQSDLSEDVDLSDKEHCILCFNDMHYFSLGRCNHKNVCYTCILRLRFIMKDRKCPICKSENEEILIARTQTLTFEQFNNIKKGLPRDNQDEKVFYETELIKKEGSVNRELKCLIHGCRP